MTRTTVDSRMRSEDNEVLYNGRTKFDDLERSTGEKESRAERECVTCEKVGRRDGSCD